MRNAVMFMVLVLMLIMGGCTIAPIPSSPTLVPEPAAPTSVVSPVPAQASAGVDWETKLFNNFWVSPAVVEIGNYHSGARKEWRIRIHNGRDTKSDYLVSYKVPVETADGYAMPLPEAEFWVMIAERTPMLAPKETRDVLVAFAIPDEENTKYSKLAGTKWEFWIRVVENPKAMVNSGYDVRWLVQMR